MMPFFLASTYVSDFIMPVAGAIFGLVIMVALIIVIGKSYQATVAGISRRSLEQLADELRAENAYLKAELSTIKETLFSIDSMMKEIE